jgi:putative hydrolase of the HAD superfamily
MMKLGLADRALAASIVSAYGLLRDQAVAPFPRALSTIAQLRHMGIRLALLTNGNAEAQWAKIRRFELAPLFDCLLIEGEFGVGKPDERIYLHALQRFGVAPEETWMVGDNFDWEVAAPQALGIKGVWIDHKGHGVPTAASVQPYLVIGQLSDLLSAL